jgi:hypothetical protein
VRTENLVRIDLVRESLIVGPDRRDPVRNAVGINGGNMRLPFQAARSIGER